MRQEHIKLFTPLTFDTQKNVSPNLLWHYIEWQMSIDLKLKVFPVGICNRFMSSTSSRRINWNLEFWQASSVQSVWICILRHCSEDYLLKFSINMYFQLATFVRRTCSDGCVLVCIDYGVTAVQSPRDAAAAEKNVNESAKDLIAKYLKLCTQSEVSLNLWLSR